MPRKTSAKQRIKDYLLTRIGKKTTARQIQAAAGEGVTEWARRVRELRNEEGWPILTNNDDSSLKPGEYRLAAAPPENYQFARSISNRIRAQVLERNGYTCQMCGAGAGEPDPQNPARPVRLHVGHILDKSHGGADILSNLRTLCSACNQGAQNLTQEPPSWTYLLGQVRRASIDDQEKILEWLQRKFQSSE